MTPAAADVPPTSTAQKAVQIASQIIAVDLLRTFPSHPFFNRASAPLIEPLQRVLLAFTLHHPHVGYCQGLNFVAGLMLLHGDEADAFALLCTLCERVLPGYHTPDMGGLHTAQAALLAVLGRTTPRTVERLRGEGVPIKEQTTGWLLCAFIDAFSLEATLRVWDLLFADGQVALIRAAASAFALHEERLLAAEPREVFDLGIVLDCDAGCLMAASLRHELQTITMAALAEATEEA